MTYETGVHEDGARIWGYLVPAERGGRINCPVCERRVLNANYYPLLHGDLKKKVCPCGYSWKTWLTKKGWTK